MGRRGSSRLQWTSELHQRFLDSVGKLGLRAVPSLILSEMDVTNITRLQVASHLQKCKNDFSTRHSKYRKRKGKRRTGEEEQEEQGQEEVVEEEVGILTAETLEIEEREGEAGFGEAVIEEEKTLEIVEVEDSERFYNRCKVYGSKSTSSSPVSPLEDSSEYWFQDEDYQKEVGNGDLQAESLASTFSSFLSSFVPSTSVASASADLQTPSAFFSSTSSLCFSPSAFITPEIDFLESEQSSSSSCSSFSSALTSSYASSSSSTSSPSSTSSTSRIPPCLYFTEKNASGSKIELFSYTTSSAPSADFYQTSGHFVD